VPVLDGGHLLFYFMEFIFRRPVPQKVREYAQQIGMVLLLGLMVLAFYNDIIRYFVNRQG
ncbi:MAG: site-2 protease family protein, partial [Desulfuromonadales bacterium]